MNRGVGHSCPVSTRTLIKPATSEAANDLGIAEGELLTDEFVKSFENASLQTVADLCSQFPFYCRSLNATTYAATPGSSRFSVIRTGTGDLELLSAGNLSMDSLYGVYTAGTSSSATYAGDPYNLAKARHGTGVSSTVLNDAGSFFEQFAVTDGQRQH